MNTARALALGAAFAAAMLLSSGALATPKRSGKVVRVERKRTVERTALRLCQMENQQIGMAQCLGGVPEVGDEAVLVDPNGYVGRARVIEIRPAQGNLCGGTSAGDVLFEYTEGAPSLDMTGARLAVFGVDTGADARSSQDAYNIPPPSGRYGETPYLALDRNGDKEWDVLTSWYDCSQTAPPNPFAPATPTSYNYTYCIDHWTREDGGAWERARTDYWYSCN